MSLNDQVAIVTGASRGIGQAIAVKLGEGGCKVAGISRSVESSERTAPLFEGLDGSYKAYGADVSKESAVNEAVEEIFKEFGRIDILVNNAGITKDGLLMRMTEGDWESVLQTNLKGAFYWTRAVSKYMIKARYGRIVNISSIIGLRGNAGQCNYAAAKAGLIGFSKSVARELAPRGITCNILCPGFIQSDMTEGLPQELKEKLLQEIPLKRMGDPKDIAGAVAFMCSDDASYVTGQTLAIDGGLVM